jgi:predicted amidohydrolase
MDILKVGLAQITSIDDVNANLEVMIRLLEEIQPGEVDAVFFPENCLFMRLQEGERVRSFDLRDPAFQQLAECAKKKNLGLHLGSVPVLENGLVYNSSVWIDSRGTIESTYKKIHLFDIQLENQKPIRESDIFMPGEDPRILEISGWKMGQAICYDLRFSNLFHHYAKNQVDAVLIPSSFLVKTGQAHWDVLMRARAIESQCYVIASAQSGSHQGIRGQRETYGHSVIVDPWGAKLLELTMSPELQICELSRHEIERVRTQIPMKGHRRGPF